MYIVPVKTPQLVQARHIYLRSYHRNLKNVCVYYTFIVVPIIYKKGEKSECSNYRGISLLNTAYKILATVINNRLTTYAEDLLRQEQNGFRRNRSTTDNIFMM